MASCAARSTNTFLFLADTPWAISAQYFLFCIIRTSSSFTLWISTFLKPLGIMCLVVLDEPYPMLGMRYIPLNLRRTLLSIPFGFLQLCLTLSYLSDWWRMNFFVRFLTILGREAGVRAMISCRSESSNIS